MKKFLSKIILLSIPFVAYIIACYTIDPYNLFGVEDNQKLAELKRSISYPINRRLYKLPKYLQNPTETILLGDSRTANIDEHFFSDFSNSSTTNLAYGGGSLQESIETFWYISKIGKLKYVYIGINFNLYNAINKRSLVSKSTQLIESPISYAFSKYSIKSLGYISKALVFDKKIDLEKPPMNKSDFWKHQLEVSAKLHYQEYVYPNSFYNELKSISEYCVENGIELTFFIPPTHIDLQTRVEDFNLKNEEIKFKSDLASVTTVYDFDFPNNITTRDKNYGDPYHFNDSIARIISEEIISKKAVFSRQLPK